MKIELDNGKYTLIQRPDGRLEALRYGEPWRDLVGDNLILALGQKIEELENNKSRESELLEDFIRDKRIIGEALGLEGESATVHKQQLRAIRDLKNP